eukprot:g1195.t1
MWLQHYDVKYCRSYWFNSLTGESSWSRPSSITRRPTWSEHYDKNRSRKFWFNYQTKESVWSDPRKKKKISTKQNNTKKVVLSKAKAAATRKHRESVKLSSGVSKNDPHGWGAFKDATTGRTYYFNKKTGESSWIAPDVVKRKRVIRRYEGTPWSAHLDPITSKTFYFNRETKISVWVLPVELRGIADGRIWSAHVDEDSGSYYYFNKATKVILWTKPSEAILGDSVEILVCGNEKWASLFDATSGKRFWLNCETFLATWNRPRNLIRRFTSTEEEEKEEEENIEGEDRKRERNFSAYSEEQRNNRNYSSEDEEELSPDLQGAWVIKYDENGDIYYVNNVTGESKWLPPGWEEINDQMTGSVYYFNDSTGETSWKKPGDSSSSDQVSPGSSSSDQMSFKNKKRSFRRVSMIVHAVANAAAEDDPVEVTEKANEMYENLFEKKRNLNRIASLQVGMKRIEKLRKKKEDLSSLLMRDEEYELRRIRLAEDEMMAKKVEERKRINLVQKMEEEREVEERKRIALERKLRQEQLEARRRAKSIEEAKQREADLDKRKNEEKRRLQDAEMMGRKLKENMRRAKGTEVKRIEEEIEELEKRRKQADLYARRIEEKRMHLQLERKEHLQLKFVAISRVSQILTKLRKLSNERRKRIAEEERERKENEEMEARRMREEMKWRQEEERAARERVRVEEKRRYDEERKLLEEMIRREEEALEIERLEEIKKLQEREQIHEIENFEEIKRFDRAEKEKAVIHAQQRWKNLRIISKTIREFLKTLQMSAFELPSLPMKIDIAKGPLPIAVENDESEERKNSRMIAPALARGAVCLFSFKRTRKGKEIWKVEIVERRRIKKKKSFRDFRKLKRQFEEWKKEYKISFKLTQQKFDEAVEILMKQRYAEFLEKLKVMKETAKDRRKIVVFRMQDKAEDAFRPAPMGDIICMWSPHNVKVNMDDRMLCNPVTISNLVGWLSSSNITAPYTLKINASSIEQNVGANLEYSLIFHKLYGKGKSKKTAVPKPMWRPTSLMELNKASGNGSREEERARKKRYKEEDIKRGPLPLVGDLPLGDNYMMRKVREQLEKGNILIFTFHSSKYESNFNLQNNGTLKGDWYSYEIIEMDNRIYLNEKKTKSLKKEYNKWKKMQKKKYKLTIDKFWKDLSFSVMRVRKRNFLDNISAIQQRLPNSNRICVFRTQKLSKDYYEPATFGDVVLIWNPNQLSMKDHGNDGYGTGGLRDKKDMKRRMQTTALTVNHLIENLTNGKVFSNFMKRVESGSIKQVPGNSLNYDDVYLKLFQEFSKSERWGDLI